MLTSIAKTNQRQTTLAREVHLYDRRGGLRLVPARADEGLLFHFDGERQPAAPDLHKKPPVWGDGRLAHLLAAIYAAGLDNVLIEVSKRLPHPDDSAEAFAEMLAAAGTARLPTRRSVMKISSPGTITGKDGGFVALSASKGNSLLLESVDDRPRLADLQAAKFTASRDSFRERLAWTRHGSRGKGRQLTDEAARHELMHVMGGLALLPWRLAGAIRIYRPTPSLVSDLLTTLSAAGEGENHDSGDATSGLSCFGSFTDELT